MQQLGTVGTACSVQAAGGLALKTTISSRSEHPPPPTKARPEAVAADDASVGAAVHVVSVAVARAALRLHVGRLLPARVVGEVGAEAGQARVKDADESSMATTRAPCLHPARPASPSPAPLTCTSGRSCTACSGWCCRRGRACGARLCTTGAARAPTRAAPPPARTRVPRRSALCGGATGRQQGRGGQAARTSRLSSLHQRQRPSSSRQLRPDGGAHTGKPARRWSSRSWARRGPMRERPASCSHSCTCASRAPPDRPARRKEGGIARAKRGKKIGACWPMVTAASKHEPSRPLSFHALTGRRATGRRCCGCRSSRGGRALLVRRCWRSGPCSSR